MIYRDHVKIVYFPSDSFQDFHSRFIQYLSSKKSSNPQQPHFPTKCKHDSHDFEKKHYKAEFSNVEMFSEK